MEAVGLDDQDVEYASTFPEAPPGREEGEAEAPHVDDLPSEPQKDSFGGKAGADLLRHANRWNRITTRQMRSLGSKDQSGPQEFATSEDVPAASTMCQAVVLEMPSEPKPGPRSLVLPGQHVWAFFDSAMTIVHLDYARMVSGKDCKTGKYWIGIEFPIQDIVSMPPDENRRPGSKAELRNTALRAYSHVFGPYGTRFTDLLGHVTLGCNIAADDELIETMKQYVLTMLRMSQKTVCKDDPRAVESQSAYTPSTHRSILGHSPVDDEGDVTALGGDVTAGPFYRGILVQQRLCAC
jgi:hypothetical protein